MHVADEPVVLFSCEKAPAGTMVIICDHELEVAGHSGTRRRSAAAGGIVHAGTIFIKDTVDVPDILKVGKAQSELMLLHQLVLNLLQTCLLQFRIPVDF